MSTREKILEAALRLFSLHGYSDTSLSLVAREAKVSKALILWHFSSKENLFRAVLARSLEPYTVDHRALQGLSEQEQIERLVDDYYDFIAENLYSVKFVLELILRGEEGSQDLVTRVQGLYHLYWEQLAAILEKGRSKGSFTARVDPARDATLILATLSGLLLQQFATESPGSEPRAVLERFKLFLRTWLLPPGEAKLEGISSSLP